MAIALGAFYENIRKKMEYLQAMVQRKCQQIFLLPLGSQGHGAALFEGQQVHSEPQSQLVPHEHLPNIDRYKIKETAPYIVGQRNSINI